MKTVLEEITDRKAAAALLKAKQQEHAEACIKLRVARISAWLQSQGFIINNREGSHGTAIYTAPQNDPHNLTTIVVDVNPVSPVFSGNLQHGRNGRFSGEEELRKLLLEWYCR